MKHVSCGVVFVLSLAGAHDCYAQTTSQETEIIRAKLYDPAAFISKCDSAWLWKLVSDHPDDFGKNLTERMFLGLFELAHFQGSHGVATAAVGALHCGMGMGAYTFPVALVADGPDTSVSCSCTPIPAEHSWTERFADITGDGLPELVLSWLGGNQGWGLVFYSLRRDGVLTPLGRIDSASGQLINGFLWSRIVETNDSKLPVIESYNPHQDTRPWHFDSTIRYTNTYYRFRNGVYERAREISCLPRGKDTVEIIFDTTGDH